MSNTTDKQRKAVSFAAINSYVETNVILPTEKSVQGKDMVEWGERNCYPDYLLDLYRNVPTLHSIINGNIDFITGDDVTLADLPNFPGGRMNRQETIREQVKEIAKDYELYGGFALQVIRNLVGEVSEIHYVDMRFLRTNKEGDVFYYCEKWNKGGARKDVIIYPAFIPDLDWASLDDKARAVHSSSILFVKSVHTQVYPAPVYAAAVKACEIERLIDDFHISDLNNHFVSSAIINFNNGDPLDDDIKQEISDEIEEKFCGASNGGRIMVSWNPNKESATDIVEFKVEDFGERYKALSEHSRRQIFCSFRAIPLLFGMTSEANTGFATDEFEQSFKLYNRTQIQPVQRTICDAYDKILGVQGAVTIRPFSLAGETEDNIQ